MIKFGRVIGIVGLVALLSVPLTMFLWDWQFTWLAAAKIVFGVSAIVYWFLSNAPNLKATFQGRATFYLAFTILFAVIGLGVAVIVNYIFYQYPVRFDMTKEKIHSLSEQSVQLLSKLDGDLEVSAFYNSQEPQYEMVRECLDRYRYESNRFHFKSLDPVVEQNLVENYNIQGTGPRIVIKYRDREERVKIDQEHTPEESITTALLKLTTKNDKPKVCFSTGHGEKTLQGSEADETQPDRAADEQLNSISLFVKDIGYEGYSKETLLLAEKKEIPADCGILVLAGPRSNLTPHELGIIKKYLDGDGKLLAFIGAEDTGSLSGLLKEYGIEVGNDTVVSLETGSLTVFSDPALYPQNHPIFSHLRHAYSAVFPITRSVRALPSPTGLEVTSLVSSGKETITKPGNLAGQSSNVTFDKVKDLVNSVSMAATVERKTGSSSPALEKTQAGNSNTLHIVVFGSSLVVVDAVYLVNQFNRNLVMNSLAWLTNESAGVTIRPNFRAATLLRLNESQMKFVTFFSIDILPLLILAFGIAIWQIRRWS